MTEGFRGIYEVGEQARPYGRRFSTSCTTSRPCWCRAAGPARSASGSISAAQCCARSTRRHCGRRVRALAPQQSTSIAVCLLFSFLHPQHEERVGAVIAEELPECSISLSSAVLPQIREYYRLSTTVINAYLQPMLARYIDNLDRRLAVAGVATPQKYIMQSNGGMSTFEAASRRAVDDGVVGSGGRRDGGRCGRSRARRRQHHHLRHGRHLLRRRADPGRPAARAGRGKIEGHDIAVPMMDINTVSAGGGTIAGVDRSRRARRSGRRAPARRRAPPVTAAVANGRPSPTATSRSAI